MQKSPLNIVVTGGNSGIGYETVKELYLRGHNLIFGSRNQVRNKEAIANILKEQTSELSRKDHFIKDFTLDLANKKSVQNFVANVKQSIKHIDVLINNAGFISNELSRNEDGIQMTLAIGHFGHFYLTYLLFDSIKVSSQGRIITVSSMGHFQAPKNILEDIECKSKSYSSMDQYGISKFMNVLFTQELSRRVSNKKNIKTFCLDPGHIRTNLTQGATWAKIISTVFCCMFVEATEGARTSVFLATQNFQKLKSGQYYDANTEHKEMDKRARDLKLAEDLWRMSEKVYGIKFEP